MDERTAYLGLNLISGVGPGSIEALVRYCGSAQAAWSASTTDWQAAGLNKRSIRALNTGRQKIDFEREWAAIERAQIKVVLKSDPEYPEPLKSVHGAPPLLYMRGAFKTQDRWSIAVVGTRNSSSYGDEVTTWIVRELAQAGITIVSGLAYGIDTIAHTTALTYDGRTLAVLGSGLAQIYPPSNTDLAERITQQGALISEFAPTLQPVSGNFPARNRLISALALGTLVIEAGERSGALITANFAVEQGRSVFAVPGSILSRTSLGTNTLIQKGAHVVRCADDIITALELEQTIPKQEAIKHILETPAEAILLPLIEQGPIHADELCRLSNLSTADIIACLGMMELKGMIKQMSPMVYIMTRLR